METLPTTAGSIGIRPNGTDLSDFRSIRGGATCRDPLSQSGTHHAWKALPKKSD